MRSHQAFAPENKSRTVANTGSTADSQPPDKDGLINLLERAFNLNPNQPGLPILTAGTGTSGLPLIRRTGRPPVATSRRS